MSLRCVNTLQPLLNMAQWLVQLLVTYLINLHDLLAVPSVDIKICNNLLLSLHTQPHYCDPGN